MSENAAQSDLATLGAKLGQLIRTNELKMAGKLLATARGYLHQLSENEPLYAPHYERVAELRNELMEPGSPDFQPTRFLEQMLAEEVLLKKTTSAHPSEPSLMAHTLLNTAAAVVLVYCQDRESGAPLDF